MRNAMCARTQTSKVPTQDILLVSSLFCGLDIFWQDSEVKVIYIISWLPEFLLSSGPVQAGHIFPCVRMGFFIPLAEMNTI